MISRRGFLGLGGLAVAGDGLIRPINAPPEGKLPIGVQPGVSSAVVIANKVIVFGPGGSGIFVYSPSPGPGKLVYSIAAVAGTDPYGNLYKSGATSYGAPFFVQTNQNTLVFGNGTMAAVLQMVNAGPSGQLTMASNNPIRVNGTSFVQASGDTTGATDSNAIALALAVGFCVLADGPTPYYVSGAILLPQGATLDGGGATIRPGSLFTTGTGMIMLASSTVTNTTVRDVILLDNYTIGGGCGGVWYDTSTSVPNNVLRHVTARGFNGSGFRLGASAGSASAHVSDCVAFGNFGDGFQLTSDQLVSNCEAGFNMGHGFHLLSGASNVYLANCLAWYSGVNPQTSVWPAAGTSCGYFLEAPVQYSHLVGCHAQQNGLHGYAMGATSGTAGFCYQVSVAGCGADTNSAYGAGGVGSGMFVSGVQSCVITGFVGDNNGGLSPGSQLWGIQAPGGLVKTIFAANTAVGTAGRSQIASRWVAMTLLNSWANNGAFGAAKYTLLDTPANTVEVIGAIDATAATAATFATLPAGFRPASAQGFPAGTNGGNGGATMVANIRCDTAGNLTVNNNAGLPVAATFLFHGFISLDA